MNNYGESGKGENAISQNQVKVISFIYMYNFRRVLEIIVQRMEALDDINDARKSLSFAEIGEHKTTLTSLDLSVLLGNEALP